MRSFNANAEQGMSNVQCRGECGDAVFLLSHGNHGSKFRNSVFSVREILVDYPYQVILIQERCIEIHQQPNFSIA
jgi:hypothetical protein